MYQPTENKYKVICKHCKSTELETIDTSRTPIVFTPFFGTPFLQGNLPPRNPYKWTPSGLSINPTQVTLERRDPLPNHPIQPESDNRIAPWLQPPPFTKPPTITTETQVRQTYNMGLRPNQMPVRTVQATLTRENQVEKPKTIFMPTTTSTNQDRPLPPLPMLFPNPPPRIQYPGACTNTTPLLTTALQTAPIPISRQHATNQIPPRTATETRPTETGNKPKDRQTEQPEPTPSTSNETPEHHQAVRVENYLEENQDTWMLYGLTGEDKLRCMRAIKDMKELRHKCRTASAYTNPTLQELVLRERKIRSRECEIQNKLSASRKTLRDKLRQKFIERQEEKARQEREKLVNEANPTTPSYTPAVITPKVITPKVIRTIPDTPTSPEPCSSQRYNKDTTITTPPHPSTSNLAYKGDKFYPTRQERILRDKMYREVERRSQNIIEGRHHMPPAPPQQPRKPQVATTTLATTTDAPAKSSTTIHNVSDSDSSEDTIIAEIHEPSSPTYSLIGHFDNQGKETSLKPTTPDIDVLSYSPFNQENTIDPEFVTFAEENAIEIIENITEEYRKEGEDLSGQGTSESSEKTDKQKTTKRQYEQWITCNSKKIKLSHPQDTNLQQNKNLCPRDLRIHLRKIKTKKV